MIQQSQIVTCGIVDSSVCIPYNSFILIQFSVNNSCILFCILLTDRSNNRVFCITAIGKTQFPVSICLIKHRQKARALFLERGGRS